MKIIHIKAVHKPPVTFTLPASLYNEVIQSQFQVAQELKKLSQFPILQEGLYEYASDASSNPMSIAAKIVFPKGFPDDFNKLSILQKQFLFDFGATQTLFFLGELQTIYPTIKDKATAESIDKLTDPFIKNFIVASEAKRSPELATHQLLAIMQCERQKEALMCAQTAARKHFGKIDKATIVIVFGALHDFKPLCDQYEFSHVAIDATHCKKQPSKTRPLTTTACVDTRKPTGEEKKPEKNPAKEASSSIAAQFSVTQTPTTLFSNISAREKLQYALKNSDLLSNLLKNQHAKMEDLIHFQQNKPWLIDALRYKSVAQAIYNHHVNIKQLSLLTEEQVGSIVDIYDNAKLQNQVEEYIKLNQQVSAQPASIPSGKY